MDGNNIPIGTIQRLLGLENRKTMKIHLHSLNEMERDAMAVFERARKKSHINPHTAASKRKRANRCSG
jgi:hypothetical protein